MYMLIDVNAVKRKITKTKPEQSKIKLKKTGIMKEKMPDCQLSSFNQKQSVG